MTRALRYTGAALMVGALLLALTDGAEAKRQSSKGPKRFFDRIATFPVYENSSVSLETAAEIVAASKDGKTLVYTDSPSGRLGFVDIKDPGEPKPDGTIELDGEPTSVAVHNRYALVAVNTSANYVNTSGQLDVIDIDKRETVATIRLGGQPDSIAVSPDGRYAAIAIENERDEDLGDGRPPQSPAGYLSVIRLEGHPSKWSAKAVALTGLADRFPTDPEPEYVDINQDNLCVVTLQENNHIVLVDLESCEVTGDFSAGSVDLDDIDVEDDGKILLDGSQEDRLREPDSVQWIDEDRFAIANEGDLDGGSRGFTIFHKSGKVLYESGNSYEHIGVRIGHYPDGRSDNKGVEPEGLEFGRYGSEKLLFVGSERGNFVLVYEVRGRRPEFVQALPCTNGPEGLLAIPQRGLFVVASEVEDEGEGLRSTISIYQRRARDPFYPTIYSANDVDGLPIPWGALSGLAADRSDPDTLYAVTDSFYGARPRILEIDVSRKPARIVDEIVITKNGAIDDNYDLEGIVQRKEGGFWLASEGRADGSRKNLLIRVNDKGEVQEEVELPAATQALKTNNGFEGVALRYENGKEVLYAAIQREWSGDAAGCIRIGEYRPDDDAWRFFYYSKSAPTSPAGGWVGLSEIVWVEGETLALVERDNQRGPSARIKWITEISLKNVTPVAEGGDFPKVSKKIVRDLLPILNATHGWTQDKVEGLAVSSDGDVYVVTDNDGVDDSTGETQFFRLGDYDDLDCEDE